MPAPRAVVTTEAPAAPILLSLYADCGLVGRIELSLKAAVQLAADLLNHAITKGAWGPGVATRRNDMQPLAQESWRWERALDAARELDWANSSADIEAILTRLLTKFDACDAENLPAYAMGELVRGLLRVYGEVNDDA